MTQQSPNRASDPGIPGSSQACIEERDARKALEQSIGSIARELAVIRTDIGKAPDPTLPGHEREGTGLKGIAIKTFEGMTEMSIKLDKLAGAGSMPPAAQSSLAKKVSYGLVILFLAVQQAWTLYRTMTPNPQPPTAQVAPR